MTPGGSLVGHPAPMGQLQGLVTLSQEKKKKQKTQKQNNPPKTNKQTKYNTKEDDAQEV